MIGTVEVRVSTGHPNMPLKPCAVLQGSALTVGVQNVPVVKCGVKILGVSVAIQSTGGEVATIAAVFQRGLWNATFPASHFAAVG